jgi:HD-GYP domain-containing protein (c-di-GMP phosphodiesterase class II)
MIEVSYLTRVPVTMLRFGLYVAELDRPWHDVPVMFQGFEIRTDEELRVLQEHCQFVYVEGARSSADAYERLESEIEGAAPEGTAKPGQTDLSAVLGNARHPQKQAFRERIQAAANTRSEVLAYLDRVLEDARLGRTLNSRHARALVEDMAAEVSCNASAHMWLTNLKNKDEYSSVHSVNVCVLTLAFGMYLGLRGEQLYNIGVGALLHDVGKVNQPPELLAKTSPLNARDWEWIRRHPEEGCDIISNTRDLPREALDIIRMHHERIDGMGFPRGLKGDEIPYHVRIVALVNLYDSLTANRPYRPGRPADEVLQDIYNGREKTFGAKLVQEFIHCIGIFPIGSLVELDNGALGVVLGSSPTSRLKPTILLVRTPQGQPYEKRLLLNLAAEPASGEGGEAQHIRRVVNPARYNIDVSAIVAFEFGVDW